MDAQGPRGARTPVAHTATLISNASAWRTTSTSRALGATRVAVATVFALAGLSGLAYAAGFPPLSWSIAPWLALAPLLVACAALSPLRAARGRDVLGGTAAVGLAWFLPRMLAGYFGLATVPSWIATLASSAGCTASP